MATSADFPLSDIKLLDWETIFEGRDDGIIIMLESARSVGALRKCTHLIIQKLFTRKDDEPIRISYEKALDELLPDGIAAVAGGAEFEDKKNNIITLLRDIKE